MFTHILLASDGSEAALRAARAAADLTQKYGAKLTLLSVFDPPPTIALEPGQAPLVDPEIVNQYCDRVLERAVQLTEQELHGAGVEWESRCEVGHPVDVIVATAARSGVDLIVVGHRGMGRVESFLLGSVSERVLYHAHCPVLVVR